MRCATHPLVPPWPMRCPWRSWRPNTRFQVSPRKRGPMSRSAPEGQAAYPPGAPRSPPQAPPASRRALQSAPDSHHDIDLGRLGRCGRRRRLRTAPRRDHGPALARATPVTVTESAYTISGLSSGTTRHVQVRSLGPGGMSAWSEPQSGADARTRARTRRAGQSASYAGRDIDRDRLGQCGQRHFL